VIAFMLAGALLAAAVVRMYRLVLPPRVNLTSAVASWDRSRARSTRTQRIGLVRSDSTRSRLVGWIADQVTRRASNIGSLTQDLSAIGEAFEDYLTRTVTLAAIGLVGPAAILTVLNAAGLGLPYLFGPILGVALAVGMVLVVRQEVADMARRRRSEFRRALSIYLDLIAMSLQAGRGHAEALPASAAIGSGWAFAQLQDAIEGARFAGITAWEALGQLGHRIGMRELTDLEAALRLASDDGAKVRATLIARAQTLRAARIADAEADAARATESMKFALIVMVFVFLSYELYPSVARLFAG
jgi:Flp pilus assembly protein TadB